MGVIGQCVICFSALGSNDAVSAGKCGHVFHQHCLTRWIKQSRSCPSCRVKASERDVVKLFIDEAGLDDTICSQTTNSISNKVVELTEKLSSETSKRIDAQEQVTLISAQKNSLEKRVERLTRDAANNTNLAMKIRHLENCLENERFLKRELADVKLKLKTCEFYNLLKCDEKGDAVLDKFITPDGNPDTDHFLKVLRAQLKKAKERISENSEQKRELSVELENQRKKCRGLQQLTIDQNDEINRLRRALEERGHSPPTPLSALRELNTQPRPPKLSLGFDLTPSLRSSKKYMLDCPHRDKKKFSYEEQDASDFEQPTAKKYRPISEFSFDSAETASSNVPIPAVNPVTSFGRTKSTFGTSTFEKLPSFQLKRSAAIRSRAHPLSEFTFESDPISRRRPENHDESVICLD